MKKLLPFLLLLTNIHASFIDEHSWLHRDLFTPVASVYESLGGDNNYMEFMMFETDNVEDIQRELKYSKITKVNIKRHEAFADIKRCVFMQEGAYGKHLDNAQANRLTKLFYELLLKDAEIHLVENIQFEIVNNRCAILITDKWTKQAILMQGVSFD